MNARFVALRTKDMEMQDHTFDARNILKVKLCHDFIWVKLRV